MVEIADTPTLEELQELLEDFEEHGRKAYDTLTELDTKLARLTARRSEVESAARGISFKRAETQNRIFVRQAISPELVNARDILIKKFKLLQDDQITVARQRELEAEIENYQPQLQKFCPHPFIFAYARYGQRVCTLCNLGETSKSTRDSIYGILVDDSTRLVLRDLRERDELPKLVEQEWFTINFLKQLFDASAGGSNVRWPDTIDPASVLKL